MYDFNLKFKYNFILFPKKKLFTQKSKKNGFLITILSFSLDPRQLQRAHFLTNTTTFTKCCIITTSSFTALISAAKVTEVNPSTH